MTTLDLAARPPDVRRKRPLSEPEPPAQRPAAVMPPSNGTPALARAAAVVAAPEAKRDVTARAQMSVALQQNVGNARMGAMVGKEAPPAREGEVPAAASVKASAPRGPAAAAIRVKTPAPEAAAEEGPAAGAESEAAGGGGGGGRVIAMKMPEPPARLGPAARARVARTQSAAAKTATVYAKQKPADEQVAHAQAAVTKPIEQANAEAASDLVEALGKRAAPDPKIEALCQRIYEVIAAKRPADEDELVEADTQGMAKAAGDEMSAEVDASIATVDQSYETLGGTPAGLEPPKGEALPPAAAPETAPAINAGAAKPDAIPAKDVSLDADVADSQARIDKAGMNKEPAKLVTSGPIAEARKAEGELEATAAEGPAEVLAGQQALLGKAGADLADLQRSAVASLANARKTTTSATSGQQKQMVGSEESMRRKAGADAQKVFAKAQTDVNALLLPLPGTARKKWDTGVQVASTKFKQDLQRVEGWIAERHSGIGGSVLGFIDDWTGLPSWVTDSYDAAEKAFGDEICSLAREVSADVNGIVLACEALIATARTEIDKIFLDLPAGLREWADAERAKLGEKLDGLSKQAHAVRDNFTKELVQSASQTVQDVRAQVQALRQKAKGILGRIADWIEKFIDDPVKAIIEGLLAILSIPSAAFWAVVAKIRKVIGDIADDPMKFANNLMTAVGQGFSQFFDHFTTHLYRGFIDWLTGGLASAGVELPKDASLKSILTFLLQLMGITWPRIRLILAKHLGEKNIALVEKVYSLVETMITLGPEGIFELIKEKLDPRRILDTIVNAAIDFMMKSVVEAVSARILLLFNPVGAILQALEAIYRVLKWIFTNAARIFRLIETVVNGIADIIAGNITSMANAIEKALAQLLPPVIDFLADYLNFGDLPNKVRTTIEGFQETVTIALDAALLWLIEKGKGLLKAVGLGGAAEKEKAKGPEAREADIGEKVTFYADGEEHSLWIRVEGGHAIPMVASAEPSAIEKRLDAWEKQADNIPDKDVGVRAKPLISKARALTTATDATAEELVRKSQEEKAAGNATPSNATATLSKEEHALADLLQELFEIFSNYTATGLLRTLAPKTPAKVTASLTGKTKGGMERVDEEGEWRAKYGPATLREHHLIPRELLKEPAFTSQLAKLLQNRDQSPDEYIDRRIAILSNAEHKVVHAKDWNPVWKTWLDNNQKFTLDDLETQIKAMMKDANVPRSSRTSTPYGKSFADGGRVLDTKAGK